MLRLALAILVVVPAVTVGQDDPVKKQKAAADENLKPLKLTVATAETDSLLLYTTLPEAKAKAIAAAVQKTVDANTKLLKVEDKGKLWPGKLTVVVLPTRANYNSFVRLVLKERPDAVESHRSNSKGDTPFVLIGVEPGTTSTDATLTDETAQVAAQTVLARYYGTSSTTLELPFWLSDGFGRVAAMRTDGNAAKLAAHRAKQRALFGKKTIGVFKVGNVWGTEKMRDLDVLSASFVEYLLFAPEPKFDKFVSAFKPGEGNENPTTANALAALMWMDEAKLDAEWKAWVTKLIVK